MEIIKSGVPYRISGSCKRGVSYRKVEVVKVKGCDYHSPFYCTNEILFSK